MRHLNGRKLLGSLLITAGLFLVLLVSCLHDSFSDRIGVQPSVMMPLAHGSLSLGNLLLTEGSSFTGDPDSTLRLVLSSDSLIAVSLHEILDLPVPDTVSRVFGMGPVKLKDFSTTSSISLHEIAGRIKEPEASLVPGLPGENALFPAIPEQAIGDLPAGKIQQFEYALFTSGEIGLTARNDLPVPVSMEVRLLNQQGRQEIARFGFQEIQPGASATLTSDLQDKFLRQDLVYEIISFSTASASGVTIDLSRAIELEINAYDLYVIRGKARLEKILLDTGRDALVLNFANDVELQELVMQKGLFNYLIVNSSRGLTLEVVINTITKEGEKLRYNIKPDGRGGYFTGNHVMSDVDVDVSKDVRIDMDYFLYAGSDDSEMTEFDLSGEIFEFDLWFSDFQVGYASGYLGSGELRPKTGHLEFGLDFFRNISGDLLLSKPLLRLYYENSGGIPSELLLNMTAVSADSIRQVNLFDEDRRAFPIVMPAEPYTSVSDEILITHESSNISEFLRLTPPLVRTDVSVLMNPLGRKGGITNFITSESRAYMGVEFELPLDMRFTDLILTDTIAFVIDPVNYDLFEEVFLNLQITNSLPGSASVSLALYDSLSGLVLHNFGEIMLLGSAGVGSRGEVIPDTAVTTETEIDIPKEVIDHLRLSSHFIISSRMNSGRYHAVQVPVRFRTVDQLDFRIRLRARLNVGN
jgi:hypothetical protein